ncbi:MAG: NPCBM/NEW2 domain-containing protein, partial [Planctomycetes bacterium]|nr:NPCBM/NEW2 domain-containing protein [Planctomycetota bacterium]
MRLTAGKRHPEALSGRRSCEIPLPPVVAASFAALLAVVLSMPVLAAEAKPAGDTDRAWVDATLRVPRPEPGIGEPVLQVLRQDHERLERRRSVIRTPLRIGEKSFERGLGAHSVGRIRIQSPEPIERIAGWVGVDLNERTSGGRGSVTFAVSAGGREVFRSK